MPALTDLLTKMGTSGEIALTIAVLALLGLIVFIIYRTVFSHRLRVPGGRTRQPRLGVVDAFSVDGQRQLVLVRRDNVEHLILIGGPNDVLVESQIVRMAAPAQQNGAASVAAVASPPPPPPPQAVAAPTPPAPTVIRPLRRAGRIRSPPRPWRLRRRRSRLRPRGRPRRGRLRRRDPSRHRSPGRRCRSRSRPPRGEARRRSPPKPPLSSRWVPGRRR